MTPPLTRGERQVLAAIRETTGSAAALRLQRLRATGLEDSQVLHCLTTLTDLGLVDLEEEPP